MDAKPDKHDPDVAAVPADDKPAAAAAPAATAQPPPPAVQPPVDATTTTPVDAEPAPVAAAAMSVLPPEEDARLREEIVAAVKTVYDPEIPADIYELGLIYDVAIDADRNVVVTMTLTAPGCPVAGEMPMWVENAVNAVPGVAHTTVNMTFDPPWDMSRMSDEARLALNMF
jgi:FeS assembly SUF system protein